MSRATRTFYEFFAGGGMARLGLGSAWTCTFANDFDPVKAAVYRDNFPDAAGHFHEGDVWKLAPRDLPGRADLAWASSPCQDFSLAGARAGLAGGRSSAFFGFWKLVQGLAAQDRAPRMIVIENVVGLLTSHEGRDFQALCKALHDEGYNYGAVELDARRFLPQSRPRVFVVAVKGVVPGRLWNLDPVEPFHSRRIQTAHRNLPQDLRIKWRWWSLPFPPGGNASIEAVLEPDADVVWYSQERTQRLKALLSPLHLEKLEAAKEKGGRCVATVFRRMRVERGSKIQRAELRFDGYAGCLRTAAGGSSRQALVVVEGEEVRGRDLTSRESARLMGLDDDYRLPKAKTSALKILGDGVAVPVVKFLSENLLVPLLAASQESARVKEPDRKMAIS